MLSKSSRKSLLSLVTNMSFNIICFKNESFKDNVIIKLVTSSTEIHYFASFSRNFALNIMQANIMLVASQCITSF